MDTAAERPPTPIALPETVLSVTVSVPSLKDAGTLGRRAVLQGSLVDGDG